MASAAEIFEHFSTLEVKWAPISGLQGSQARLAKDHARVKSET